VSVDNEEDVNGLLAAGRVVRLCLDAMARAVRPGITTAELNEIGARILRREASTSAPMQVYGFPAETCISVNDEVVHGIPSQRPLRARDLVKLDVTANRDGYIADAAITVPVGALDRKRRELLACTRRALLQGVAAARAGRPIRVIGTAVDAEVRRCGFSVIRELTGHGVGRTIHEAPAIPNYDDPSARRALTLGLVITVEPLVAAGRGRVVEGADGWTMRTLDGSPAAHEEHTIIVTRGRPIVVTRAA
jgi:methionyl aminopeptidase